MRLWIATKPRQCGHHRNCPIASLKIIVFPSYSLKYFEVRISKFYIHFSNWQIFKIKKKNVYLKRNKFFAFFLLFKYLLSEKKNKKMAKLSKMFLKKLWTGQFPKQAKNNYKKIYWTVWKKWNWRCTYCFRKKYIKNTRHNLLTIKCQ